MNRKDLPVMRLLIPFYYPRVQIDILELEDELLERDSVRCFGEVKERDVNV